MSRNKLAGGVSYRSSPGVCPTEGMNGGSDPNQSSQWPRDRDRCSRHQRRVVQAISLLLKATAIALPPRSELSTNSFSFMPTRAPRSEAGR